MGGRILVDLGWLAGLSGEIGATTDDLRRSPNDAVSVPSSPWLERGIAGFLGEWDEKSGQLADCLQSVHDLTNAIHDSFVEADRQLGDATSGS